MTRKDYILISDTLRAQIAPIQGTNKVRDAIHNDYCRAIAGALAADNPAFDRAKFLAACGVQS